MEEFLAEQFRAYGCARTAARWHRRHLPLHRGFSAADHYLPDITDGINPYQEVRAIYETLAGMSHSERLQVLVEPARAPNRSRQRRDC